MTKPVFQWKPDLGAQRTVKPSVRPVKFGDGYEMRVPLGVNYKPRSWSVRFTRAISEIQPLLDFLEARGGVEAFSWVDPLGNTGTYVCREWNHTQQGFGLYAVSGTFEQVFEY